jgi:hypothetical protein
MSTGEFLRPVEFTMLRPVLSALIALVALTLAGCDQLGIESPEKVAAARTAEGAAIGGACRHAGRAIEDCYTLNRKADKAAIFAGWRDMNDYMRENKIEAVSPQLDNPVSTASSKASEAEAPEADTHTAKAPKDAKDPAAH